MFNGYAVIRCSETAFWVIFVLVVFSSRRDIQHFGVKVSIVGHSFFNTEANSGIMERDLLRLWNRLPNEMRDSYGEKYFSECK